MTHATHMTLDRKMLVLMVGFLIGVFVAGEWGEGWVLLVCVFGSLVCWWRLGAEVTCIVLIGVVLGFLRFFVSEIVFDDDVRHLNGRGEVEFVACVSEEVDVRVSQVKYTVSDVRAVADAARAGADDSADDSAGRLYDGNVLLNASRYPVFEYGDVLKVRGAPEAPQAVEDFAYDKYLARYGIYSVVDRPVVEKVGDGCGNAFLGAIYGFKGIFEKRLGELFTEPHGSLVAGVLLGVRSGIPKDVSEDFKEIGLTHIVAISGYNITLVIIVVSGLFGFLSRKRRIIAAIAFIVVFVILVGAGSAVVRASIMGILGLLAIYWGRRNDVAIAIVLSAVLMNLWNPKIIVYDVGFQLSFLATLGLVYVSPKIEALGGIFGRVLAKVPRFLLIRENLIMTLSAQAFALPVILKAFGRFSLICPIANIFILPFVPFVMLFGFLAVVCGFVSEWLGSVLAFVCYVLLECVFFLAEVFAAVSRLYM
ncbi:MAG: ComEC/Rec2 family competence protein [Candidatus Gracilibacteria bacterium]